MPVALNGAEVWGLIGDTADGMRIRLSADEWERADLCLGQRVLIVRRGLADILLYVADIDETPPLVWATFTDRLLVEG